MAADKNMYSIGDVARLTNLSHQTLRYYDSIKLIVPQSRDSSSGYRYYTEQQVILLMIIRRLRDSRCSLEDIRGIVNEKRLDRLYELLDRRNRELEHEIAHIQAVIHKNTELINRLYQALDLENPGSGDPGMRLEEFAPVSLFCERKKHSNYNIYFTSLEHWASLYQKCERLNLKVSGPPFAIFHSELLGQFIMRDCDFTLALSVEPKEGCDKISGHGGFPVATTIHKGSYLSIVDTYIRLLQWINTNGYEARPPAYEQFIISPIECLEPEMLITKIMLPVTRTSSKS